MEFRNNIDFQTPEWCCNYMADLLPQGIKTVLEPAHGAGVLERVLLSRGYFVTAPNDFFAFNPSRQDAVVMNPPFTPMKLGYEIFYKCMELSDVVIALMPWLTIINSEKRTKKIMEFGLVSITHLPRSTFQGSRVQTCVLQMQKGFIGKTEFKTIEGEKMNEAEIKGKFVCCEVLFPHCRTINGKMWMLEPLFSGQVWLPNDEGTKKAINEKWLKVIAAS